MAANLPTDVVEIDYSVDERDVRALIRHRLFHRRAGLLRILIGSVMIVGGCLYVGPFFFPRNDRTLVPQVVSLIVGLSLYGFALSRGIEAHVKVAQKTKALGPRTLTISPEGILQIVPNVGETMRPWSAIEKVIDAPHGLILDINEYQSLYLPRRVFGDESDHDRYVELVNLRVAHAKQASGSLGA